MSTQQTRTNLKTEDDRTTLTTQILDEDGKVLSGETQQFNSREEAEAFMATGKTNDSTDNKREYTVHGEDVQSGNTAGTSEMEVENNVTSTEAIKEKPASQMTEADAVALNADVHVATPNTDTDRVVTDGEKEQVAAGLHPKPESGKPELKD